MERQFRSIEGIGTAVLLIGLLSTFRPYELLGSQGLPATVVSGGRGRLVFASSVKVGIGHSQRMLEILDGELETPGFPADFELDRPVTISLATQWSHLDADAWAHPPDALIVLPLEESRAWSEEKLRSVLRHELTHIRIGAFLGFHHSLPRWFEEGFAEWAAGGVTCEGEWRLRIDLQRRKVAELPVPRLGGDWMGVPKRIAYDYYAMFFEYLDAWRPGFVASGDLLALVKKHDLESALLIGLGMDLSRVERGWKSYLAQLAGSRF